MGLDPRAVGAASLSRPPAITSLTAAFTIDPAQLPSHGPKGYTRAVIISASRRCDMPAFQFDWLLDRLRDGFCEVPNPWDARRVRRVSLAKADVDCLVLWTRDPRPILARLGELEDFGLPFYVQVTITAYPRSLEPGVAPLDGVIEAVQGLARRLEPRRVVWRYDPIIAASGMGTDFHAANFGALAGRLSGAVERVVLSLLDEYRGTASRLAAAGLRNPVFGSSRTPAPGRGADATSPGVAARLPPEPYPAVLGAVAGLAARHAIAPFACAEPWDLSSFGIRRGACVDSELVARIAGGSAVPSGAKDRGQRPFCGCAPSVDIGRYGPCPAACVYCYARR